MTKEELLKKIDFEKSWLYECGIFGSDVDIAFHAIKKSVIEALEQEPCEDCISRQAAQDYIAKYLSQYLYYDVREAVEVIDEYIGELPSVNPQKIGHWKVVSDGYGDKAYICECSECKDTVWVYKDADRKWNYCPNCGARMIEPQESEDKE